jgi:hypothetical protein
VIDLHIRGGELAIEEDGVVGVRISQESGVDGAATAGDDNHGGEVTPEDVLPRVAVVPVRVDP